MEPVYTRQCLMKLAIQQHLQCSEYPRVGVVIAKDGQILSTGFRGESPGKHAERVALEKLKPVDCVGSTIYTTLEPCIKLHENQEIESCAQLIISSQITEVVIGILDPNGTIYAQGYQKLLENNITVSFFNKKLRKQLEEETFEYGKIDTIIGAAKRSIPVINSGSEVKVQFSTTDSRTISFRWASLQYNHGCVDLISSNGAVRIARGARKFSDITDHDVFRFPSHFGRMEKGWIAVVQPEGATFCVLVQLINLFDNYIIFRTEVRNNY